MKDTLTSKDAGYIWVVASDDHEDLICVRSSTAKGALAIPFEEFPTRLSLESGAHLRYFALVEEAPKAVEAIHQFLADSKVSEQVFVSHPAVAATVIETCGTRIRSRRSLFNDDGPDSNDSTNEGLDEKVVDTGIAQQRSRASLNTLTSDIERSLGDADSLLEDASTWLDAAKARGDEGVDAPLLTRGPAEAVAGEPELSPVSESDTDYDPYSSSIGFGAIAKTSDPKMQRITSGHRNPLREELSTEEIVAMEGWILGKEARQHVARLRSLQFRGLLTCALIGIIAGLIAVLALNLPAEHNILTRWVGAGLGVGAITWLMWFWRFRGGELSKWRRICKDTAEFAKGAPRLPEVAARRMAM